MEIIPDKRKVVGLVEQAHEGKICLPNFQRDFVWTREEVADLVRSIMRGYFIGSLLLLRCEPNNPPFAPQFLRGSQPPLRDARPEYLVLDGQQRLSSLIYALTAPDLSLKDSSQRRWFFVNLDVLLTEPDSDEVVFDRAKRELRGLDKIATQYEQRMLPCTALLTQELFYQWRDGWEDWLGQPATEDRDEYRDWRNGWTTAVSAFQNFDVPLVELPRVDEDDGESIGRVCAIFEKLNSTGVDLSVYDLLTARLYRHNIRLHDLWDEAVNAHARLKAWSKGKADEHKFGVLVLRTLALMRGLDPKPRILIDLQPANFENDWRRAVGAIERALELIELVGQDGFGVFAEKWLPGYGLTPILAALRAEIDDRKLGQAERDELRRWYWCNVFLERYSSAVESKSRKDYLEMTRHWFEGGPEPEVFREAQSWIGSSGFRVRPRRATPVPCTAASSVCSRCAAHATGAAARTSACKSSKTTTSSRRHISNDTTSRSESTSTPSPTEHSSLTRPTARSRTKHRPNTSTTPTSSRTARNPSYLSRTFLARTSHRSWPTPQRTYPTTRLRSCTSGSCRRDKQP